MKQAFTTHVDKEINHDGFKITFANDCTISVMFGKYTYSDGGETTAEVAAWNNISDKWMLYQDEEWTELDDYSEVMPRHSAEEVANLIYTLSRYSPKEQEA
jgi:hypothetical protein